MNIEETIASIHDYDKKLLVRVFEEMSDRIQKEIGFNKDRILKLIDNRNDFQDGIGNLVTSILHSDRFADEEVLSNYVYPKAYNGPKPIKDQIKQIAEIFNLDAATALEYADNLPELPEGAEGWFAIPKLEAVAAKHLPVAETYFQAVQLVQAKISDRFPFFNDLDNFSGQRLSSSLLRVSTRTARAHRSIDEKQSGDIFVIPAQLGRRHLGLSIRRVREVFLDNEFGLGSFEVGVTLLTHPGRFMEEDTHWAVCTGDEYDRSNNAFRFQYSPSYHYDGKIRFGEIHLANACSLSGPCTGFIV